MIFRNATLALAWFWGGFVLLTEGFPGFVRMAQGLGYSDPVQIGLGIGYTVILSLGGATALWLKGLK